MRELKFTPMDRVLYADLLTCFMVGERASVQGAKGFRTAASVYDKLERIAVKVETPGPDGELTNVVQKMQPDGGEVLLEEAEHEMLRACIEAVLGSDEPRGQQQRAPVQRGFDARRALRVLEFLKDAPKA